MTERERAVLAAAYRVRRARVAVYKVRHLSTAGMTRAEIIAEREAFADALDERDISIQALNDAVDTLPVEEPR